MAVLLCALAVVCVQRSFGQQAHATPADEFITTWKTNNPGTSNNTSITISTNTSNIYSYNFEVDWNNDGIFEQMGITSSVTHDFGAAGEYTIRIRGEFPYFTLRDGDPEKLMSVDQWGNGVRKSMEYSFDGATNMVLNASDSPNLSQVTSMAYAFSEATAFNGDLSGWDTSNVDDMLGVFNGASKFNGNLSGWNTSRVERMNGMFSGATSFNGDISGWDTSSVGEMVGMFRDATSFDRNLSSWNMSSVGYARSMFDRSGMSTTSYDVTLAGWSTQQLRFGVVLGAEGLVYCDATIERQSIIDVAGWTIKSDRDCTDTSVKAISGLNFRTEDSKLFMDVSGTKFINEDNQEFGEAFNRSLVTLNGNALPFCSFMGLSAEDFVEQAGVTPGLVSDNPPCYLLNSGDYGENLLFTAEQVIVQLPTGFNSDALGSVSVNGSPEFLFGRQGSEPPVKPTPNPTPTPGPAQAPEPTVATGDKKVDQYLANRYRVMALERSPEIAGGEFSTEVSSFMIDGATLSDGITIEAASPTFSGQAPAYSEVAVRDETETELCVAKADQKNSWSCTSVKDLAVGEHEIRITIESPRGEKQEYGPYRVTAKENAVRDSIVSQNGVSKKQNKRSDAEFPVLYTGIGIGVVVLLGVGILIVVRRSR